MNHKKMLASIMTASMILSAGSTLSFAKTKKKAPAKITLNKKAVTIKKGKTFTLKLKGTKTAAKASVSNKKIVKLTPTKKKKKVVKNQWAIKGLKAGKTKVTVKLKKKKYVCKITVLDKKAKKKTATKTPANSTSANYSTAPSNNSTQTKTQTSASAPSNTAQTNNTQTSASAPSNTVQTNNTQTSASAPSNTAQTNSTQTSTSKPTNEESEETPQTPGDTDQTTIKFLLGSPLDVWLEQTWNLDTIVELQSNKYKKSDIKYTSSNPEIATVDAKGLLTPKKQGSTNITVTVGTHTATLTVNVHDVTVNIPEFPCKVNLYYLYNYKTLARTVEITNITEKNISYYNNYKLEDIEVTGKITYVNKNADDPYLDDMQMAVLDENNKDASEDRHLNLVYGKKEGSTIKFSASVSLAPDKTYNLKFLTTSEYDYITHKSNVDDTILKPSTDEEITKYLDNDNNIHSDFKFSSTYYRRSDLKYSSSDESIATIDSCGFMTGKSVGKVDITVSVGSHKIVLHYYVHGWTAETPKTPFKINIIGNKSSEPPATISTSENTKLTVTNISFKFSSVYDKVIDKTMWIEGTLDNETSKYDYYTISFKVYDDSNNLLNTLQVNINSITNDGKTFKGYTSLRWTQDKNYRIEFDDASN